MGQIVYTTPVIRNSTKLKDRVFVEFYYNQKRVRVYTGSIIGMKIFPGRAKTIADRTASLKLLSRELSKTLADGTFQKEEEVVTKVVVPGAETVLTQALEVKLKEGHSLTYNRDLIYIHRQFVAFMTEDEKQAPLPEITLPRIIEFLSQFASSNTYYMHKRTDLSVLFSAAGRPDIVMQTRPRKPKPKMHVAYRDGQVEPLLEYIRKVNPRLAICCMLTYSTWLRPHIEIRQLTRGHFTEDYSDIVLSTGENKGGRVRVVFVPHYAKEVLKEVLDELTPEQNIFSGEVGPLNPDYFKTAWTRMKTRMKKDGLNLLDKNQTIYSFRHTAAVRLYRKAKDIGLVQRMLGHATHHVTEKYLRGLGEGDRDERRDNAPELY